MTSESEPSSSAYHHLTLPGTSQAAIQEEANQKRATNGAHPPEFEQFQGTLATQEYIQATIRQGITQTLER